ncbi:uncharacterized protein F5147DRAFT_774065 [Suillus discolor]|uniref:Uncharacterized protein n=1 Tax=Suillus discolor TaxID=1912936 RepID=A0A9P7F549_9AGAM|nr:uncharacterized protein F5147DRAFT_774065 [Suillus discolor]KAG2107618.1 hypothetical protein F5147DRAFT_774065 [Suillus discolor]
MSRGQIQREFARQLAHNEPDSELEWAARGHGLKVGFAKVPVQNGQEGNRTQDDSPSVTVQGIGDSSVGATIHALCSVKGASTIPANQQVLGGQVENYCPAGWLPSVTEQQMIMKELAAGSPNADFDIQSLSGEAESKSARINPQGE